MLSLLWLPVAIWFSLTSELHATGTIRLHLVRYSNPEGKDADGDRCDTTLGIKTSDCDPYFQLCVGTADGTSCNIANIQSGVYRDSNTVVFGSTFGSRSNPLLLTFASWPEAGVRIKVQAYDEDNRSDDDLLDTLVTVIRTKPAVSRADAVSREIHLNGRTRLTANLRVYCDDKWYGQACDRYCSPKDNPILGHYSCSDDGHKVCLPGWQGDRCTVEKDECLSNPCQNDGLCQDLVNGYRCQCKSGFEGVSCEIDLDECLSDPCKEGSTCIDEANGFVCLCSPGFTGPLCDLDSCFELTCYNGGTCEHNSGSSHCVCSPGFTGVQCESEIDECASGPCQGAGSRCVDLLNGFVCNCSEDRTGETCSELAYPESTEPPVDEMTSQPDPCAGDPCLSGVCERLDGSYTCHCLPGFTGPDCSVDLCAGSPCGHYGTCRGTESGYICDCSFGPPGPNCTSPEEPCKQLNCSNGGQCRFSEDHFTCACPPGYTGDRCQNVINPCDSHPCLHGGSCQQHNLTYTCRCLDPFEGEHCEVRKRLQDPDSRDVFLFVGRLEDSDVDRLEAAILKVVEENTEDATTKPYRLTYETHTCHGADGTEVTVFTYQVLDSRNNLVPWYELEDMFDRITPTERNGVLVRPLYNGTNCMSDTRIGQIISQQIPAVWHLVVGVAAAALVVAIIASLIVAYRRRQSRSGRFDVVTNPLYDQQERRGTTDTILSRPSVDQSNQDTGSVPVYYRSHSQEYPGGTCIALDN